MKVIYKKSLCPLYPFEEGNETYYTQDGAKIIAEGIYLWEVHEKQNHKWIICKLELLVEIV
jgi:hypothetical protein